MGCMQRLWSALFLCFLYTARVTSTVVRLDDATFESATQASTGQTTGHWFVLFACTALHQGQHFAEISKAWDALSEEAWQENYGFQVAQLDTCLNKQTTERFAISDTAFILFRDRMMYRHPKLPQNHAQIKEALLQFVLTGYQQAQPSRVPPPKSFMASLLDSLFSTELGALPIAILSLGFAGVLFGFFLVLNQQRVAAAVQQQKQR